MPGPQGFTIGDLSARTGLAVSAIRFYETRGILHPLRNQGGHRRYARADLRRLSFVMAAQSMGFGLAEIAGHMAHLPPDRAPTKSDWARISAGFGAVIDARIAALQLLRDRLDGCIGCGCLSMETCPLHNPGDEAAAGGPGPRLLREISPPGPIDSAGRGGPSPGHETL